MKIISIIALTIVILGGYAFGEDSVLPSKAEKALQNAKAAIFKEYRIEVTKLLKDLERLKLEETKSGSLQGALAVDELIKEVSMNSFLLTDMAKDIKKVASNDLLGNDSSNGIVGKWLMSGNREMIFNKDGTSTFANFTGKWERRNESFFITWSNGSIDEVVIDGDKLNKKGGWTCIRVK